MPPQPRSPGRSGLRSLGASGNHRSVPAGSRPPCARPSPRPHSQSKPHRQPAGQSEPGTGRRFHRPGAGEPEHAHERTGRSGDGGRGGPGARLAGLVVLGGEVRRSAHDRVLQLQPESLPAGDEHAPPHVPVSPDGCFLKETCRINSSNELLWKYGHFFVFRCKMSVFYFKYLI